MDIRSNTFLNVSRLIGTVGLIAWLYAVYILTDRPCEIQPACTSLNDRLAVILPYGIFLALIGVFMVLISTLARKKAQ